MGSRSDLAHAIESPMELLAVRDLGVEFAAHGGPLRAVDRASFEIGVGEILGLVGESGSGKSVTCRAILGLLPSQARIADGEVWFEGRNLVGLPEAEMRQVRGRSIAMIFQNPSTHLDPVMSIGEQVSEPLLFHERLSKSEARRKAVDLLRQVGIPDPQRQYSAYAHELSGGLRQRAMIAAALSCQPKLLIADEPTTALDVTVQAQILRLLLDLRDKQGLSIILITHDLGVIAQISDSVAVMYAGRIVERASKDDLLCRPLHPYSQGLIRSQPELAAPGEPLPSIEGQPPSLKAPPPGCRFHPRCSYAEPQCRDGDVELARVGDGRFSACIRWHLLSDSPGIRP